MYPNVPPGRPPFLAAADPGITPAGWYTVADGRELWWDGNQWIVVPAQAAMVPYQTALQPTRMVTGVPVQTSHTFHLLMCLLTCGFWLPIWGLMAFLNSLSTRKQVTKIQ